MQSTRALLGSIVDYAGLFPPAGLDMATAVRNYGHYRAGAHAWMLGAFVVPASRLEEFAAARHANRMEGAPAASWPLSVLLGSNVAADLDAVTTFSHAPTSDAAKEAASMGTVQALELKASSPDTISRESSVLPPGVAVYWEVPVDADPAPYLDRIARAGHRAKVRTGGLTDTAFPSTDTIVRFIAACVSVRVAFKATAGLHHALRGSYRLTYEPDSPFAMMYGYLNVFLAAAVIDAGLGEEVARRVLAETETSAFRFGPEAVVWREQRFDFEHLRRLRNSVAVSFGSCSFEEPVGDLKGFGNL